MKKIITIIAVSLIVISGCSSTENGTKVCTNKEAKAKVTLDYKGKEVTKSTQTVKASAETFGGADAAKEILEKTKEKFAIDGVTYSYSISGDSVEQTLKVDYDKLGMKKAKELGFIVTTDDEAKTIGIDETIEAYKTEGFSCK